MTTTPFEQAEALRKGKQYAEASAQFAQLWKEKPSPAVGWRYAYCLRKTGDLAAAEQIARQAREAFPDDEFIKSELAWLIYEKSVKPAVAAVDVPSLLEAANEIVALKNDPLLVRPLALAVMKVAKAKGNWPVVLQWANRIAPEWLSHEPRMVQGKRAMSEREVWYINKARAMLELGQFEEARQCAHEALKEFSDSVFLLRIAALALAGQGNLSGAITEMRSLLKHPRAGWYMEAELAELEFRAGNTTEAYRRVCGALLATRQSAEYKLPYLVAVANMALALDKLDVAAAHVRLARAVRSEQQWRVPQTLIDAENAVKERFASAGARWPDLPEDAKRLEQLCRQFWQKGTQENVPFYRGTVKPYPEGRHFCYIRRDDGGGDVYALVQEMPKECRKPGTQVEFALKDTYDKKKQRPSVQAIYVRLAR